MTWRAVGVLVGIAAVMITASPVARRLAWIVARGLGQAVLGAVALVVIAVRERRAATRPAQTPATTSHRHATVAPRAVPRPAPEPPLTTWRVLVEVVTDGGQRWRLTAGTVTGPWRTPAEVEAEGRRRWTEMHGPLPAGRLVVRAAPATPTAHARARAAS